MGRLHRFTYALPWTVSLSVGCLCLVNLIPLRVGAIAASHAPDPTSEPAQPSAPSAPRRPVTACPNDLETLTTGLLRDLPSYANRVAYRNFGKFRQLQRPSTVILASQPDFESLGLPSPSSSPAPAAEGGVDQIFLTTLERQYNQVEAVELQHYHWLFLTQAESGWYLAFMFSRLGTYPSAQPLTPQLLTPPRDSSNGLMAEAIRLWLRDCRAGSVYPVESIENGD